jgi:glycosyltransferase involved in cell wall biosynthesis
MGGGERQVFALVAGSAARGIAASLAARDGGELLARARRDGLDARPLRVRIAYDPLAVAALSRWLRAERFDVVHLHDGGAASVGVAAAARARVPAIVHRRIASPLRRGILSRWKYAPRRVARFVAVSEAVAEVLARGGIPREKIAVVPSGVDLTRLEALVAGRRDRTAQARETCAPGTRVPGAPVLGTVSKLAPKKGVDVVLRAFARVGAAIPEARLRVVGEGPERADLESSARELGIAERVELLGAAEDGAAAIAGFDLLLFGSRLEGSPGVVREAMALGTPVVALDAPGTVEVLGGTGEIAADPVEMAERALALLRDPLRARALAESARERVRRLYSMEAMVDATIALAREVAGRR